MKERERIHTRIPTEERKIKFEKFEKKEKEQLTGIDPGTLRLHYKNVTN